MYVNIPKTMFMMLGFRKNLIRTEQIDVYIEHEVIQNVEQHKLLGVIIDKHLSWDKQIDFVCLNISSRITLRKLLSKYIDSPNMKLYYNSYILPIMEYGCLILGRCTKANTVRLLKHKERTARIIFHGTIMTPSQDMFRMIYWLTFPKRVQYHSCTLVFNALCRLAAEYISKF